MILAAFQLGISSCKETESGMGTPEITGVRVCDPEKADSLFTKSTQGQMIAIIGNNLADAKEVYINGKKVSFSTTMNTDHSIIVTVPSEDDDTFNLMTNTDKTIKVITSHGEATYNFTVLAQSPAISRVQGVYPRKTGDSLKIYGYNIYDIQKMYFTDVEPSDIVVADDGTVPGNHVDVADFSNCSNVREKVTKNQTTYYQTTSKLGIVTPNLSFDRGSLVIETGHGTTYIAYGKTPGVPVIGYMSSDMPEIGETLVLTGREFVQVENVSYGDVSLDPSQFAVSESEDSIYIPFTQIPTQGSDARISVTTPGGTTYESFYDYGTLLVDFDGIGADNGWDPKAETASFPGMSTGNCGYMKISEIGPQWWGTMIFYRGGWTDTGGILPFTLPEYSSIPENAPASKVFLAMEVYDNNSDYNNGGSGFSGYLRYTIFPNGADTGADDQSEWTFDNFEWVDYEKGEWTNKITVLANDNNEAFKCKWYRHVMALDKFPCFTGKTYAEIKAMGIDQFRIQSINQHTKPGNVDVRFDNIRLIYIK